MTSREFVTVLKDPQSPERSSSSRALSAGEEFTAGFSILGADGNVIQVSGEAQLLVLDVQRREITGASVVPNVIRFTNGIAVTALSIQSSSQLPTGSSLALKPVSAVGSPRALRGEFFAANSSSNVDLATLLGVDATVCSAVSQNIDYSAQDLFSQIQAAFNAWRAQHGANGQAWNWPLALQGINGTFGEWRTPQNHRHVHAGVDFRTPAGGEEIRPARNGIILRLGSEGANWGDNMIVDHADGTWSIYRHITAQPGMKRGLPVTTSDVIATVAPISAKHLHFEIVTGPDRWLDNEEARQLGKSIGRTVNPDNNGVYLNISGSLSTPVLDRIVLTPKNPGVLSTAYKDGEEKQQTDWQSSEEGIYVVVQSFVPNNANRLSPYRLLFQSEAYSSEIAFPDMLEASAFSPDHASPDPAKGLADYFDQSWFLAAHKKNSRFWFRWPTAGFSAQEIGPRTFTIDVSNRQGASATSTFKFGPEIISYRLIDTAPDGRQHYQVSIKSWLGDENLTTQRDRYKLVLSGAGMWSTTSEGELLDLSTLRTKFFETSEERVYDFYLPASSGVLSDQKITASSSLVAQIAHERTILPADRALISTGGNNPKSFLVTFTGGSSGVVQYSVEIPGRSSRQISLPKANPGAVVQMVLNAQWPSINLLWGYSIELGSGWEFTSVKSDQAATPTNISGTTHSDSLFRYSFNAHNGNTYTLRYTGQ